MEIESTSRPLVSLVLIAYRQAEFIREAVTGALSQTYSPLEIVLCDDCSPDDTFKIMEEMAAAYTGPHRIVLNRNPVNLGAAANLNRGWEISQGEFVVVQAGDDVSLPDRTERLVRRWLDRDHPVDLVCSYYNAIDGESRSLNEVYKNVLFVPDRTLPVDKWRCGAAGSCAAYSRKLLADFGPLDTRVIAEDWVYSFRAWVSGGLDFVPEPLVLHRRHGGGISIQARGLSKIQNSGERYALRKKLARSSAGIAAEWLKAWRIGKWKEDKDTERALERLVELRTAQFEAFEAGAFRVLGLALKVLRFGGLKNAGGLIVRHLLRVH